MPLTLITPRVGQYVAATLVADGTFTTALSGGLYELEAPQGNASPYGVYSVSGENTPGVNGTFILQRTTVALKLIGVDPNALVAIADRAITLLHRVTGSADGVTIAYMVFIDETPQPPEWDGDQQWWFRNLTFHAWAHQ